MTNADMARVERLIKRLQGHRCLLIVTGSPVGYYIRENGGSIVTRAGYPLTLSEAEEWEEARRA